VRGRPRSISPKLHLQAPLIAFVDDDAGYLAWLRANPTGYVVNTARSPHPDYLILHRASCRHLTARHGQHLTAQYVKIVSPTVCDLERWCLATVGGASVPCGFCQPR
jgi:hypothetical protein